MRWALRIIGALWIVLLLAAAVAPALQAQDNAVDLGEAVAAQADAVHADAVRRDTPEAQHAQPLFTGCTAISVAPVNADFEQQVVELVNDHRAALGKPPLKRVSLLDSAARYHSRDMRDDAYVRHDTHDRVNSQLVKMCNWDQRIGNYYAGWLWLGENIAAGYTDPASVMQGWLNSNGHRANIESLDSWEIGMGYDAGGSYGHYWTQDFGRRPNVYPLVIQREYSRTATPQVTIHIYGNWQQMRLRNDAGAWGAWQPFSSAFTWQLNWIQGVRQVCAELQSGSQTVTSCDTIELTTNGPALSVQPAQVSFVYVLSTGQRFPQSVSLNVTNSGNSQTLTWQASASPAWLTVTPASGSTPNANAQLTLNTSQLPGAPGAYAGAAQFNATNASAGATVNVSLRVVNSLPYRRFIPLARR